LSAVTDNTELTEFIKTTIESVKKALDNSGCVLSSSIDFDLAIVKTKEGRGKVNILVVDAGGKYAKEEVSRITFHVSDVRGPAWADVSGSK
jgi:hypothetical protein